MVLRAVVFTCLDLASAPGGLAGGAALSCDVVPVQEVEPLLASADSHANNGVGVAAAGGMDAPSPFGISQEADENAMCRSVGATIRKRGQRRRLTPNPRNCLINRLDFPRIFAYDVLAYLNFKLRRRAVS